jgi:hypothetical protein
LILVFSSNAFAYDATEMTDSDTDGVGADSDAFSLNSLYSAASGGASNGWEIKCGLDPNDPSNAISGQDNDGANALTEFLAGTSQQVQ